MEKETIKNILDFLEKEENKKHKIGIALFGN